MPSLPRQLAILDHLAAPDEERRHLHALIQTQGLSVTSEAIEEAVAQVDLAAHPELAWPDRPHSEAALEARRLALAQQCKELERKLPHNPSDYPEFLIGVIGIGMAGALLSNVVELFVDPKVVALWLPRICVPLMIGAGIWSEVRARLTYRKAAPDRARLEELKQARHRLQECVPTPAMLRRWGQFPLAVAQVRAWKVSPVGLLMGDAERLEKALKATPPSAEQQALTALFAPEKAGTDPR